MTDVILVAVTFHASTETFAGRPVVALESGAPLPVVDRPVAWRFEYFDEDFDDSEGPNEGYNAALDELLDTVDTGAIEALVLGSWGYAAFADAPIVKLCEVAHRLPNLEALFLGDITGDECEASWIRQGDLNPLLEAFPKLRVLRVRGTENLRLSPLHSAHLRELAFESGGLPAEIVTAVLDSDLPALEHLEFWLGVRNYGGDVAVRHLEPLLAGGRFPALRRLGLRNAEIADRIAAALAGAPLVGRLEELDLSMGVLDDSGAEALLAGQPLTHLRRLSLRHNFLSPEFAARVVAELPGVAVDVEDQQTETQWGRYTAVGE
ncbi:STM4015 family protein [Dactylosporangium sp. NPDC051541]|uniref:STM4015 family protein n=1 Tax=Dactylosporangium sp. NPDC051541 TaxID=3363977 RepID=UPI00378F7B0B